MIPYEVFHRLMLTIYRRDVAEPARPDIVTFRVDVFKSMPDPRDRAEELLSDASTPDLTERVRNLATERSRISPLNRVRNQADLAEDSGTSENAVPSANDHGGIFEREENFKQRYIRDLDKGRPLKHRINAVKAFTEERDIYSADVIMAILTAAEDMTIATAPMEARRAGFALLQVCASHSGLGISERDRLSRRIMTPMHSSNSILQINALRQLTLDGRNLAPFESAAIDFLTELLMDFFPSVLRSRATFTRIRALKSKDSNEEEDSFVALLSFLRDVITYSSYAFTTLQWSSLVNALRPIVTQSKQLDDFHRAFELLKIITASSRLSKVALGRCIELLCLVGANASSLLKATKETILAMLKLPDGPKTLEVLLGLLRRPTMLQDKDSVRGILMILEHVILCNGTDSLPIVELQDFAEAIWATFQGSSVNQVDSLSVIGNLLEEEICVQRLLAEDWEFFYHLQDPFAEPTSVAEGLEVPSTPLSQSPSGGSLHSNLTISSPMYKELPFLSRIGCMPDDDGYQGVKRILARLESLWERLDLSKQTLIVKVFLFFHKQTSPSALNIVIDYFAGECLISLANENWVPHLEIITERILFDHSKVTAARCRVLECIRTVVSSLDHEYEGVPKVTEYILDKLSSEGNTEVMNSLADFATRCAIGAKSALFDKILFILTPMQTRMANNTYYCEFDVDMGNFDPNNLSKTTWYLAKLFATCLPHSAYKANELYKVLLTIADDRLCPKIPRYEALRMLIRLRCTTDHGMFILWRPDLHNLSRMLWGTQIVAPSTQADRPSSNRSSLHEEVRAARNEPQATAETSGHGQARVRSRPAGGAIRDAKPIPPFWINEQMPEDLLTQHDPIAYVADDSSNFTDSLFKISSWLKVLHRILQECDDWELYNYVVVHLPSQLSNDLLFTGAMDHLQSLRHEICQQLIAKKIHEPPTSTGLKKGDIAACLVESLTILMGHTRSESKEVLTEIAEAFLTGIGTWDRTAKPCIHALAVCCHAIPIGVSKSLSGILQKMSKIITHSDLAVDVLEFLGGLARLPEVHRDLKDEEVRTIFGIAINYLHHSREKRPKTNDTTIPVRHSGAFANPEDHTRSNAADVRKDLPQYVCALAYHVITIWFLALKIQDRPKHVGWIAKSLGWKDESGKDMMDDQSQVTLDMMHRTTYLDLGETAPAPMTGTTSTKSWIVGMSIITIQTDTRTGHTQLTKRQASGTTHATYYRNTVPLPPHHVPVGANDPNAGANDINIFPNHIFLQLVSTIAPAPIPMQPILLPDDGYVRRALGTFDRNDTVDGHKVGVMYVGKSQETEAEILANTDGSKAYSAFLDGLGTKVDLQHATFNTQGLDRELDLDGSSTYAWRDRITEIVFHVVTMMPTNLYVDPQCVRKKSHVGNDFVNIIFNDSGRPYNVETIPSQFNFVNIVVSPATNPPQNESELGIDRSSATLSVDENNGEAKDDEKQQAFKVQTFCAPSLPQISPAATPKMISAPALPGFVRQLALNASVFSLVWSSRDVGEHVSSWRNRLTEIKKLRERYSNTSSSANVAYPGMGTAEDRGGARTYHEGDAWKGILAMGGLAEENSVLLSLDFSRWGGTGE